MRCKISYCTLLVTFVASLSSTAFALDEFKLRDDMVDFDQRRASLPNNGSQCCVPTSSVNIYEYLYLYGCQAMRGSFGTSYADRSNWIFNQAIQMGTDFFEHGTSGTSAANVAESWIDNHTSKLFNFYRFGAASDWGYRTVMNQWKTGSLVRMGYGRYRPFANSGQWYRNGGHSITMAGYNRVDSGNGTNLFFVADPADDDSLNSQSAFTLVGKETTDLTLNTVEHGNITHGRYTLDNGSGNNKRNLVDGMHVIQPLYAGWINTLAIAGTMIKVKMPFTMNPFTHSDYPGEYTVVVPDTVKEWIFDPTDFAVVYLNDVGQIKRYQIHEQTSNLLATSVSFSKLAIGGSNMDVFAIRKGPFTDSITRIARSNGALTTRNLTFHIAGIDVDDRTGGLIALNQNLNSVVSWDSDFRVSTTVTLRRITTLPPRPMVAETFFSVDPKSGDMFIATVGDTFFERFAQAGNKAIGCSYSTRSSIQDLCVAPAGLVMIRNSAGTVSVFDKFGKPVTTDFSGMAVGTHFSLPKSFTMGHPELMVGPGYDDVPPTPEDP